MDRLSISDDIKNFLGEHISIDELNMDDDIFKSGYVNSLFAMQLVKFVESRFSVKISNEDLEITNFNTANNLTNFVVKKLGAQIVV
jgi:acyl carrier protein